MNITQEIGSRIRYYRTRQKISQEKLSEYSDLHPTYIGQLERGEKTPSIETLYKIARGLNISLVTLVEGIEDFAEPVDNFAYKSFRLIEQQTAKNQEYLYYILKQILEMEK
ncbi:MAG: helix-turn-helix domain-containing protein [Lachnospiraceae bacterium]|nr:helix-turn-helix domain-containing protein [Lachnospiraceae bacterium]MDE6627617.1 helix-turn-helix domain-containing protein [Lachnospiraceae bacterium]